MLKTIDGLRYVYLLESGIKNLTKNKKMLNDLNVFPVPDGDTGTNMLMTLRHGYEGISKPADALSSVAQQFATAAVFGARGNSGVIVSQFFKGIAEGFKNKTSATCEEFIEALKLGYQFAYRAVVKPVEGTMLTVVREAAEELSSAGAFENFESLMEAYLQAARKSLGRTPELLPVLKKAGVVDSGGSGVVCFFEGAQKYLLGEDIEAEEEIAVTESVDLTRFNKDTKFPFGYCIEGVLQLNVDASDFAQEKFKDGLTRLGDSIVMTLECDKVKLHIHSKFPGEVMNACQKYGEFLTIKIENMTVQNLERINKEKAEQPRKFLYAEEPSGFDFAVVAVVPNAYLQQRFFEMGADVVIMSDIAPSAQDFIDAFEYAGAKEILVFPNSSNSVLTSMHAGKLYKKGKVTVLNCRSVEECYLSLGLIDFEEGIRQAIDTVNETVAALYKVCIYHAFKDITYGRQSVKYNDFFSLCDKKILETGSSVEEVALKTVKKVLKDRESNLLTLFYGAEIAEEFIEMLAEKIGSAYPSLEVIPVPTHETMCDVVLAFE